MLQVTLRYRWSVGKFLLVNCVVIQRNERRNHSYLGVTNQGNHCIAFIPGAPQTGIDARYFVITDSGLCVRALRRSKWSRDTASSWFFPGRHVHYSERISIE